MDRMFLRQQHQQLQAAVVKLALATQVLLPVALSNSTSSAPTNASTTALTNNTDSPPDTAWTTIRNIIIILITGVVSIFAIVVFTWSVVYLTDVCCSPLTRTAIGESDTDAAATTDNDLVKEAGLYGMTIKERMQVLEKVLEATSWKFQDRYETATTTCLPTVENTDTVVLVVDEECAVSPDDDLEQQRPERTNVASIDMPISIPDESTTVAAIGSANAAAQQDDSACCICLAEYMPGESVMTGTICKHMTHKNCCMEWLQTHSHCPSCRSPMMTLIEMRTAALQVLGQERVTELGIWHETRTELVSAAATKTELAPVTSNVRPADEEQAQEDVERSG
jgi:hypothetical protein